MCIAYVDVRLTPNQNVLVVKSELEKIVKATGGDGEVELFNFRRGYEAVNVERLIKAIESAHSHVIGGKLELVVGPEASMWRDLNVFNEVGTPSVTYGPIGGVGGGVHSLELDSLYQTAQVYAMVALDLCNQEKNR